VYRLESSGISGISVGYYDFVLPGLVGMAVMTYGIIGLGTTVAQYRGQRILRRILATPLNPRTFIASLVCAHLVLAIVQSAIVLLWGVLLFDGTLRGNPLWILVVVLLGNLTFLNIGFMVAARADTQEAASGMGNAVAMPMMFLSGVFFPSAGLPVVMKAITAILPLRPMVDIIRGVMVEGASLTEYGSQLAQLVGWAIVTFFIASRVFRFERA
jgi:ABC-2 type transport system permease protein